MAKTQKINEWQVVRLAMQYRMGPGNLAQAVKLEAILHTHNARQEDALLSDDLRERQPWRQPLSSQRAAVAMTSMAASFHELNVMLTAKQFSDTLAEARVSVAELDSVRTTRMAQGVKAVEMPEVMQPLQHGQRFIKALEAELHRAMRRKFPPKVDMEAMRTAMQAARAEA
jgi:hypothetical protein